MIKKFGNFINEGLDSNLNYLLYYAFDWDDNILNMPTVIHLEKKQGDSWTPIDVSTAEFAIVRNDTENYRILNNSPEQAFSDFRDNGPAGPEIFIEDTKKAISSGKFGPAWNDFIECLSNGALFAIITARGHESESMRKGVEWIVDNVLSEEQLFSMYNHLVKFSYLFGTLDEDFPRILKGRPSNNELVKSYLDSCHFVGVSAPSRGGSPANPEKAKEDALMIFIDEMDQHVVELERLTNQKWVGVIGFSDDDIKNVKHIEDLIDNLHNERFESIYKIVVKGTKDPEQITKKSRIFEPDSSLTETSHQTPGLENSVLKFTQFGNMTAHLNPQGPDQRQDPGANAFRRATKYLAQTSKEIVKKKKSKKRD
jgi:hypothetical protein